MENQSTADYKTEYGNIFGNKAYERHAYNILPALVRQAKAEQTVTYGDLAAEFGLAYAQNLNYPLGTIGGALEVLGEKWGEEIPSIQALVVNKSTGLPGTGISVFMDNPEEYKNSRKKDQIAVVNGLLRHIYRYPRWDEVLNALELDYIYDSVYDYTNTDVPPKYPHGSRESEAHKRLKEYLALNPAVLGIRNRMGPGKTEYQFPSLDSVDVLFENDYAVIGVEVKSSISNSEDIGRGLYQCIKYSALLLAREKVNGKQREVSTVLAVGQAFPDELYALRNVLCIGVKDQIELPVN
ncbi:hypothetical protein ACFL6E_05135 [Candidatus Neomarinimicrobiota bacterium]